MKQAAAKIIRREQGTELVVATIESLQKTESALERARGLLAREQLASNCGLWISPCNSVHSFFMGYAIDLAYLDKDDCICRLVNHLKPWRGSICFSARSVVELAAGEASRLGLSVGDKIQWQ